MTEMGSNTFPSTTCNCACSICMSSGSCCMLPQPSWAPWAPGWTTSSVNLGWACTSSGHDFAAYPDRGLGDPDRIIYCRKCGEFRTTTHS